MAKIVVGVDGSAASAGALAWAVQEADETGAEVHAVGAWSFPALAALPIDSPTLPELRRHTADQIERVVQSTAGVRRHVAQGDPVDVLCEAAHDADLLVVGARGLGGFQRLLLGSVSRGVLRHSERPVVVVPDGAPYRRAGVGTPTVVVGVDARGGSRHALRLAVERAARWEAACIAVNACTIVGSPTSLVIETAAMVEDSAMAMLQAEIDAVDPGAVKVEARVVVDAAAHALVDLSRSADLLVVGRHHHRILGSVADTCAAHSGCPVLVVPA